MNPPIPPQLITLIRQESSQPALSGVRALVNAVLRRYGEAAQAILFYGSCLRTGNDTEGLVDLYLLVDSYRSAYSIRRLALLNELLPPNVFYVEIPLGDRMVRAKLAVLSLKDFQLGTSKAWFHSYLWARFAQPTGLVYARDDQAAEHVYAALAQAVVTFITQVLPHTAESFVARELWREGLLLSYKAELRAERQDDLIHLFDANPEHYDQLTHAVMALVPYSVEVFESAEAIHYQAYIPARVRSRCRMKWRVRRLQGKLLSVLRLLKGLFTFQGGPDYILWKIKRHSGVEIEMTPGLRRHPLLAACLLFWRLYLRGGFR